MWNDNKIVKTKLVIDENLRNVEEIIISPDKREEILNELRQVSFIKMEHYKISKLLNDWTIKICNKKWVAVNNLSSGKYSVNKNISLKIQC